MEDKEITKDELLVLVLIKVFPNFSNSYDLNKILSWKFGLINFNEIKGNLLGKQYLFIKDSHEYNQEFDLTEKSHNILKIQKSENIKSLLSCFDETDEFIQTLFQKWITTLSE